MRVNWIDIPQSLRARGLSEPEAEFRIPHLESSMRPALCCMKMAQDRLEKYLQAVVTGTHPGTIER